MKVIRIIKEEPSKLKVTFLYNPTYVEKIKQLKGSWWHPKEKYWTVPFSEETIERILSIFNGEKIELDPALQTAKEKPKPVTNFEDLERELLPRKYSYKTLKGYLYYNRDSLTFTGKSPATVQDNDIKDYLVYLAEEKKSATSTLNQGINALKFYYGGMIEKKFL